jgi:predicted membrane GTPase involved in stress response
MNIRNIAIIAHVDPSRMLAVREVYVLASRWRIYGASITYIK